MSDDSNRSSESLDAHPVGQDNMTDRLASLRASIRASKLRREEREEAPPAAVEEFEADDTQVGASNDELAATAPMAAASADIFTHDDDDIAPPPRVTHDSGERMITADLHRVRPSEEEPLSPSEMSLLAQMDQASDAAAEEDDDDDAYDDPEAFDVDPTVIQSLDDLRFVQGTPLYMSPEQWRNEATLPATDVYALGVMMFELLEGFPPYIAETTEEVLFKHLDAPIPEQRAQFTPDDVRDLVARMLSKEPEDRPDTAEIIDVLQRHVSLGGPDVHGLEEESWSVVEIEQGGRRSQETMDAAAPAKRPPFWVVGVVIALLVCVVGLAVASMGGDDPPPPEEPIATPTGPTEEPEKPVATLEPNEGDEPTAEAPAMEFGDGATADAGMGGPQAAPDGGSAEPAVEEPAVEEPAVEEPEPKPKPKKKKKKKRRTKKKPKTTELRELRLDL